MQEIIVAFSDLINAIGVWLSNNYKKNGWCDIVDDKPDNLVKLIQINIKKTVRI